jgi:tetratricopeptide (TPR) repeat protein
MVSLFYRNKIVFLVFFTVILIIFNCASLKVTKGTESLLQNTIISEEGQTRTKGEDLLSSQIDKTDNNPDNKQKHQTRESTDSESAMPKTKAEMTSQAQKQAQIKSLDQEKENLRLNTGLKKCFQEANTLEELKEYGRANQKHSECCFLGNLDSCIHAGDLKLSIYNHLKGANDFYKMACDEKNALGCFNLHALELSLDDYVAAEKYRKLACLYGLKKACIDYKKEGEKYLQSRKFENAIQAFTQALLLQPKSDAILALRGTAYNQNGHFIKAYQDFTEAIKINSTDPHYYSQRAFYHISRQNYELAKADYTRAISIEGRSEFFRMRGLMHLYLGNFQGTIQDCSEAIRIKPNDLKAFVNRGSAWMYLKDYQKAIDDFNQVILLDSNHIFALSNRGTAYQLMGDIKKAKSDFQKAIKIDARNTLLILNYLEAKILTDDFKDIYAYLGRAYLAARNNEEKILTVFTHMFINTLQKKLLGMLEKEFNRLLKKKILLQTNFDALEIYLKKIKPPFASVDLILNHIQRLKNPTINLFYRQEHFPESIPDIPDRRRRWE